MPFDTTSYEPECGEDFTVTSAADNLTSPGYPDNYTNFVWCNWYLTALTGDVISIQFVLLKTEENYDYVTITDVGSQTALGRFSGQVTPVNVIVSCTNLVHINFYSDGSIVDQGFVIEYNSIPSDGANVSSACPMPGTTPPVPVCGDNLFVTNEKQNLTSAGYPNYYDNYMNCDWHLTAAPGNIIRTQFKLLQTENGFDYVTITDAGTQTILGKFTGHVTPLEATVSCTNVVVINFLSDGYQSDQGFVIEYTSVPSTESSCNS